MTKNKPTVSDKNTKKEILEAYEEILNKLNQAEPNQLKDQTVEIKELQNSVKEASLQVTKIAEKAVSRPILTEAKSKEE